VGPKPLTDVLHISLSLPYGDPAGIKAFANSVSDPKSPEYRHFLTPEQVGVRYGLSNANVKKVVDYLSSQGMNVKLVSANRISILADATVAQAQAAFHISISEFMLTLPGQTSPTACFSLTTTPSVPASIAPFVTHVGGLDNLIRPRPASIVRGKGRNIPPQ
jgi:subtilase family serine protease